VSKSKAIKGQKAKQPYAIAMGDGSPFGIGGLRENWRDPTSSEWVRTFAIMAESDWAMLPASHVCDPIGTLRRRREHTMPACTDAVDMHAADPNVQPWHEVMANQRRNVMTALPKRRAGSQCLVQPQSSH
jgi:hypothetical protein